MSETTEEASVCHTKLVRADTLEEAGKEAWDGSFVARRIFNANGFQIRDMKQGGSIVALETFDTPA